MNFTEEEIEIVRKLIYDYGCEYSLITTIEDINKLIDKIGKYKYPVKAPTVLKYTKAERFDG